METPSLSGAEPSARPAPFPAPFPSPWQRRRAGAGSAAGRPQAGPRLPVLGATPAFLSPRDPPFPAAPVSPGLLRSCSSPLPGFPSSLWAPLVSCCQHGGPQKPQPAAGAAAGLGSGSLQTPDLQPWTRQRQQQPSAYRLHAFKTSLNIAFATAVPFLSP